jgi:hypothetical protein
MGAAGWLKRRVQVLHYAIVLPEIQDRPVSFATASPWVVAMTSIALAQGFLLLVEYCLIAVR